MANGGLHRRFIDDAKARVAHAIPEPGDPELLVLDHLDWEIHQLREAVQALAERPLIGLRTAAVGTAGAGGIGGTVLALVQFLTG